MPDPNDPWFADLINSSVNPAPKGTQSTAEALGVGADYWRSLPRNLRQAFGGLVEGAANLPADLAELGAMLPLNAGPLTGVAAASKLIAKGAPGYRAATERLGNLLGGTPQNEAEAGVREGGKFIGNVVVDPLALAKGAKVAAPVVRAIRGAARGERGAMAIRPAVSQAARILEHAGGATLDPKTLKPFTGTGYAVADPKYTRTFAAGENQEAALEAWLRRPEVKARLGREGSHYGVWRDPETGVLEVNVSDIVGSKDRALSLGTARGQKAAGHLVDGQYQGDIPLPALRGDAIPELAQVFGDDFGGAVPHELPKIDEARAKQMAKAYEGLPTNDPNARAAYEAMNAKVAEQKAALEAAGYRFEYVDEDPYKTSAEMLKDVRENKRLKVLKTNADSEHPFMTRQQNDDFRAVHDMTHAAGGLPFGPRGEEAAAQLHASTMPPLAQRALLTETRGQNSWVNYGPNAHLPPGQRPFAPQKAALWPEQHMGPGGAPLSTGELRPSPEPAGRPAAVSLGAAREPITPRVHDMRPPAVKAYEARQAAQQAPPPLPGPALGSARHRALGSRADDLQRELGYDHRASTQQPIPGPAGAPWQPTPRGIFDRSVPPMQGSAPVDPRMVAKMGKGKEASELAQAIGDSKAVERGLLADAEEGLALGGYDWYESGPIRASFGEMGGPVTFEDFINATGSGSIQNPTHNELATATALLFGQKRGLDVKGIKKVFNQMYRSGRRKEPKLWLNENTRTNFNRAVEAGAQLPKTAGAAERKVPWYSHGKLGGSLEAMPALDTHERKRLLQLAATDPKIAKLIKELKLNVQPGGRSDLVPIQHALDYDALGAPYQRLAKEHGLPSTQAFQAARWIGGGRHTGLLSQPTGDYVQTIEDVLAHTAKMRGLDTDPATLRALWQRAAQGDDILSPIYGKDPFRGLYDTQGVLWGF